MWKEIKNQQGVRFFFCFYFLQNLGQSFQDIFSPDKAFNADKAEREKVAIASQ